jgi:hypothetical protein
MLPKKLFWLVTVYWPFDGDWPKRHARLRQIARSECDESLDSRNFAWLIESRWDADKLRNAFNEIGVEGFRATSRQVMREVFKGKAVPLGR